MTEHGKTRKSRSPIVKSNSKVSDNKRYATTPPGTMRLSFCPECGGNYYGSEKAHRQAFHGEPIT
jgi:hypothetical protein